MIDYSSPEPVSPQLAGIGEQLRREFGSFVDAINAAAVVPTLRGDGWWTEFDALEKEIELLFEPIRELVLLQSSLTEGFVPSDLFSASGPEDEAPSSAHPETRPGFPKVYKVGSDESHEAIIAPVQHGVARPGSSRLLDETTGDLGSPPDTLQSSAAEVARRAIKIKSPPKMPSSADAIETDIRNVPIPVRGLSEFSAALRSNVFDESWLSADHPEGESSIAKEDFAFQPTLAPRTKPIATAPTSTSAWRNYDNLPEMGNAIVREIAGDIPMAAWHNNSNRLHRMERWQPDHPIERDLAPDMPTQTRKSPTKLNRPAFRSNVTGFKPVRMRQPPLAEELAAGKKPNFNDPQSPEIQEARAAAAEQPEQVIPGAVATAKVDLPSGRNAEDLTDIFDALADEIQRAYRRFYGV